MISVCVAAFNGEKYIEEQILSVLRNLDSQDEIIISDDGSSDRTRRIVDDLAEKDRRIRIIDGPRKGLRNLIKNSYIGCCMAFKRSILDYAIPFPDNIPMHDQWIGLLSERVGKVEFCNEQLLLYRRHSNNASEMTHLPLGEMVKNRAIMLKCINKRIREKK